VRVDPEDGASAQAGAFVGTGSTLARTAVEKLRSGREFNEDSYNPNFRHRFRDEISRLINLGFIKFHRDGNGRDLFDDGEPRFRNVHDYCEVDTPG
jgi:hypothetical protein